MWQVAHECSVAELVTQQRVRPDDAIHGHRLIMLVDNRPAAFGPVQGLVCKAQHLDAGGLRDIVVARNRAP